VVRILLATVSWFSLQLCFVAAAHAQNVPRSGDALNPTVPKGVPQSAQPFLNQRNDQESQLIKGAKGGKGGAGGRLKLNRFDQDAGDGSDGLDSLPSDANALISIGKIEIPNLGRMKSKAQVSNGRYVMANTSDLPVFTLRPPRSFGGYLGTTLDLKVEAKVESARDEPVFYVWIVNSRVVCTGQRCLLPLDGSSMDVGAQVLSVVAFHNGGSSHSDHIVQVVQGQWRKGDSFNRRLVKDISSAPVQGSVAANKPLDAAADYFYALNGQAVHAYPAYFRMVGDVGQNFRWRGRVRTNASGVLRMISPQRGEWYLLRKSTIRLLKPESASYREVEIEQGGLRVRTLRRSAEEDQAALPLEDMGVETPEVRVVATEGADLFIVRTPERSPSANQKGGAPAFATRVLSISGSARVNLKSALLGQPNVYNLPTGLELVVHGDGRVEPLQKPDGKRMARLQAMTITPAEVAAVVAAKNAERAKSMDLQGLIRRAEASLGAEDFFDVLAVLSPVLSREQEDVRVPFLMGIANKGLYQSKEAERYLAAAHGQDPKFDGPAWHLALLKMEEKQWPEAKEWLQRAHDTLPEGDPRLAQAHYYSGVINFQQERFFLARSDFTRALWDKNLESSMQGSAGSFLKSLVERKGWGLVAPVGVQYDANVLSLTANEAIPEPYPGRAVARSIAGLIFSADPGALAAQSGTYWGYGAKALAVHNFPRDFSSLDVVLADISLSQSFLTLSQEPPSETASSGSESKEGSERRHVVRLTQTAGVVLLDSQPVTGSLQVSLALPVFGVPAEIALLHETDLQQQPFGDGDATSFLQGVTFNLMQGETSSLSLPLQLKEKFPFGKDVTLGVSVTASALPNYSWTLSPRMSANVSAKMEHEQEWAEAQNNGTFTAGAGLGLTYFLTPWCLVLPSLGYDAVFATEKEGVVHKPLAGVLFTALF
jgi:tetratricopeptide (TPR) repeat protein